MRLIGEIDNVDHAERFAAYLKTKGIDAHLEQESTTYQVWIRDEDRIEESIEFLDKFQTEPDAEKYRSAKTRALEIQRQEAKKRIQIQRNIVKVSNSGSVPRRLPLTIMLIAISGLVALFTNFGAKEKMNGPVFRALAFSAIDAPDSIQLIQDNNRNYDALNVRLASIRRGQVWRLITPIFIHLGVIHLLFNMYWLFQLGGLIEDQCGTVFLGFLVVAVAIFSNFFQGVVPVDVGGASPGFLGELLLNGFGGMSGVIYGLFGYIWMKMIFDPGKRLNLPQSTIFILLAWLLFCMTPLATQYVGPVGNWAHAVGLVVGIVVGLLPTWLPRQVNANT